MPRSFTCVSCSAPLEFEGNAMQKCSFCGVTVIVPPEVFYQAEESKKAARSDPTTDRAGKIAEVLRLIHDGKKINAIKKFREAFGTGLAESKAAVEAMERGESIDILAIQAAAGRPAAIKIGSGGPVIPPEAARTAAKAVGGSFIVVFLAVLGIAVAGVVMFFTISAVESEPGVPFAEQIETTGSSGGGRSDGVTELLRIGGKGTGAGRFTDNRAVAVDGSGRIFSGDYSGGRLQSFDAEGKFLDVWTIEGGGNIYDLAASRRGMVYLLTSRGILAFEAESGKLAASINERHLRGLTVGIDGRVYVVGRKGISIYDPDLKPLREFPKAAEDASSSFGFDKIAVDGEGTMFMLDRTSRDIIKFSPEGKFLNRIATDEQGSSGNAIAIDSVGRIYISHTSSISIYSPEGRLLSTIKANQAFGMAFNHAGEMFIASRPEIIKQRVDLDEP